jgi:aminoglycoside phosphotransferase (APT) family kinase protein
MSDIAEPLAEYLETQIDGASNVVISDIHRIHGGASRETFRLRARYDLDGQKISRPLILRRDPVSSLIDTEREKEFQAFATFHGTDVPAPEPLYLETESSALGQPFFIMEMVEGCEASNIFADDPFGEHKDTIGEQLFSILGRIAAHNTDQGGLASVLDRPKLDGCWRRELDYWEDVIDEDELEPQPIVRAAIRFMRKNPPPPAQRLSVVHGDYRAGNFLHDGAGTIRAILDWEMVHFGDPLEDLAWSMDPLWSAGNDSHPACTLPAARCIEIWEKASGLKVDPAALGWWRVFAAFKGEAIWISSAREFAEGRNMDPVLAFSGWYCAAFHNQRLMRLLSTLVPGAS